MSVKSKNIYNELFGISSSIYNDKNDLSFLGLDYNAIDKALHKQQKCPKEIFDYKKEYEDLYKSFKRFLKREINRIYGSSIFDESCKYPINIMNHNIKDEETKLYFNTTDLWKGEYFVCEIKSNTFKKRFLSNLYCEIKINLDNIIETRFRHKGRKIVEYEDRYSILCEFIENLTIFTSKFIEDTYTFDDFLNLNKLLCCKGDIKNRKKVIKTLKNVIPCLMNKAGKLHISKDDQYEFINDIINISYVLSTESIDMDGNNLVPDKITFPAYYSMKKVLINLGEDVYVENITNKSLPILYRTYINSHPIIWCSYTDTEDNKFLSQGIKSVFFLYFVTNDDNLLKYIRKII